MNLKTNKTMEEIITNLKNWQAHKKDVDLMNKLLGKADFFVIDYRVADDSSESYHFYPALEIIEDKEENQKFELVFYMISKNRDSPDFLEKNKNTIEQFIKKFKVINKKLNQDNEITKEEAEVRKHRWITDLKKWIGENEMFEVFDIPSDDFNLNDKVIMQAHFGMKVAENDEDVQENEKSNLKETAFSPDVIIYQLNLDGTSTSCFDMARLCPPWRKRELEFALLNLII